MAIRGKFAKRPVSLFAFRAKPSGAVTTLAAAAAKDALTITVTSATGIAANKALFLSGDEDIERVDVASVAGAVVTLKKKLIRAHANGDAVTEATGYQIKDTKGGVKVSHAKETTDEPSGMKRLVYAKIPGFQTLGVEFMIQGLTIPNLCIALGIPFARIVGDGLAAATPFNLQTDLNDTDTESAVCLLAVYTRQDGTVITEEFWGCAADYTALSIQLAFGQAGSVPVKFLVYGDACQGEGANPFTLPSTTYSNSKAKVFASLNEMGLLVASGAGSTVGVAASADANSLTLVDSTAVGGAGTWVGLASDDTFETHFIHTNVANVLTLRTRLLRDQAVGVVVVPLTLVPFASLTDAGATFNIGGTSTPIRIGTRDLAIGTSPENAEASVSAKLQELSNAVRAQLAGIPASAITSDSRVSLTQLVGTATLLGAYIKGTLKDGTINQINLWGIVQDLADLGAEITTGAKTSRSFVAKPTSGVQFLQY